MRKNMRRRMARADQRGVVLLLAVPGMVMAVAAMALSVDIGRQVLERRDDQKIADLASLDAVRDIANAQTAAEASAERNGFDLSEAGAVLLAERGSVDANRVFSLDPAGDSVRVTITSVVDYIFMPGTKTVSAKAVARLPLPATTTTSTTGPTTTTTAPPAFVPSAGFTLGSNLASIDTTKAPMLNRVLGAWLKGAASGGGTADVVGWQGLLSSNVTLEALRGHLELLDAGIQFGTVDQMLNADITLTKLAQATAAALSAGGDSNASLYAGPAGIIAQSTNTTTFKLGRMIQVAAGSEAAALATRFNAFHLLTGSAMIANGTNTVSVPDIGITIPGLGTTSLSVKVIEGQKTYIGPTGGTVSTSQVELGITPVLNRPLTVAGLVGARLTGSFPMAVSAAGASGTLTTIDCAAPGAGIDVSVNLEPWATTTSTTLGVSAVVLGSTVPLFTANTTGGVALTDPSPATLAFAYAGDFTPAATGQRVGASPLSLETVSSYNATVTALGLTPIPAGLVAAITGDLKLVAGLLDTNVMTALHRTLGISVGAADVAALKDAYDTGCAAPAPPPATTTTTTTTTTTIPTSTVPAQPELVG